MGGLGRFLYITLLLDVPEKASGRLSQGVKRPWLKGLLVITPVSRGRNRERQRCGRERILKLMFGSLGQCPHLHTHAIEKK